MGCRCLVISGFLYSGNSAAEGEFGVAVIRSTGNCTALDHFLCSSLLISIVLSLLPLLSVDCIVFLNFSASQANVLVVLVLAIGVATSIITSSSVSLFTGVILVYILEALFLGW